MTTTVLAYFPSPGQGVWHLGPVPIRAYALCIIAGIIAALVIGDRRWAARGGERGVIYDIALWAVPFGLIGGRVYHVLTDWRTYFGPGGAGAAAALRIWEGGLGIWGAVAFGGVGAWIACRRRGIPLPAFGDAVAPGIVLAQAIGRLGNYFNQELYGRETTVPWGMEIFYRRDPSGMVDVHSLDGVSTGQVAAVVHPTFLYEMLWNIAVFVFLLWADRRFRLGHGRLFALYVASYALGRFWVELLRDDTATLIAGIRINVFTATFVFIGAVVYLLLAPKGREDPETLRGYEEDYDDEDDEESVVEEFAEELVAVAAGSGVVAAASVAGEREWEDAAAAGDTEFADAEDDVAPEEPATDDETPDAAETETADTETAATETAEPVESAGEIDEAAQGDGDDDFVAAVEAEELAVEAELESELQEATAETENEEEATAETEDETAETEESATEDAPVGAEGDEPAPAAAEDGPVIVYASAPVAETVVIYPDEDLGDTAAQSEPELAESEPVEEDAGAPEVLEAAPDADLGADLDAGIGEDAALEADDEPDPEPEPSPQVTPQSTAPDDSSPGLGSSLRRLLFGGRGRG